MNASSRAMTSAEPNVTPMIDVLLVLLIVFMTALMGVHKTIDVQLPQVCAGACTGADQIVLEILPGPVYRVNQRVVPSARLFGELSDIYRARPEKTIEIAGHPGVRYDQIVAAMDMAKSAGVRAIAIAPKTSYIQSR